MVQDNHQELWDGMRAYRPIVQNSMNVTWPTPLPEPSIEIAYTRESLDGLGQHALKVSAQVAAISVLQHLLQVTHHVISDIGSHMLTSTNET